MMKTILIIENIEQFNGENKESIIKAKTFKLYQRNSRYIEFVTFDDFLEKANFIVNHENSEV
jgi:hypothetical protein